MRHALVRSESPASYGAAEEVWVREKGLPRPWAAQKAPPRCVLLATDLSVASQRVEERALELAATSGARLWVLAVLTRETEVSDLGRQRLSEIVDRACARGITAGSEVVVGDPREAIDAVARSLSADIMVIGRGQWPRFAAAGSLCGHLARAAPCQVLIIDGGNS